MIEDAHTTAEEPLPTEEKIPGPDDDPLESEEDAFGGPPDLDEDDGDDYE